MLPAEFATIRRALFRAHGFDAETVRLKDESGFGSYALLRERGTVPTVLLHGGLADASVWALMAGQLHGTVVVVDRPGCGLSDPIDYTGVDYRKHASDWLRGVVDALGAPQVNLVGNSMGGYFAIAFASAHPERVRQLILPGAPAGLDRTLPLFLRLWSAPLLGRCIDAMKVHDVEALRTRVFPGLVAHPERLSDEFLRVSLAASQLPSVARTSRTMVRRVATPRGFRPELMLRTAMERLAVPTLFVWGAKDSFAPPASGLALAARMPSAAVEVLPEVGHMPQLEAPGELAALVNRAIGGEATLTSAARGALFHHE